MARPMKQSVFEQAIKAEDCLRKASNLMSVATTEVSTPYVVRLKVLVLSISTIFSCVGLKVTLFEKHLVLLQISKL